MGNICGKVWGTTELIEANSFFELHRIEVKKGGFCSKHYHQHKWNSFYLVSGKLEIHVWKNDYDLVDITTLEPGDYTSVPPGELHMFKCLENAVCFELYWAKFDHNDIIRETVGGRKP